MVLCWYFMDQEENMNILHNAWVKHIFFAKKGCKIHCGCLAFSSASLHPHSSISKATGIIGKTQYFGMENYVVLLV